MASNKPRVQLLLDLIDQSYDHHAWHGTNMRGSIRGLSADQAAWRPDSHRHNIWEILVHAAYWKYAVRRRLLGEKRGIFPLKGSNWFRKPVEATGIALCRDVALLDETHRRLREAIGEFPQQQLHEIQGRTRYTYSQLICGIAAHDLYHAGQIQLLRKLQPK